MNKPENVSDGSVKLIPCPFCGSDDVGVIWRSYDGEPDFNGDVLTRYGFNDDNTIELVYSPQVQYGVMCYCCHVETGVEADYLSATQAVEAWNHRVPSKS